MDQEHNGDGRRWAVRWQIDGDGWCGTTAMTARGQLDSEGRRDGDSITMDDEKWRECDGDVDTAIGGSNKGHCCIKL
jgi:hypothetical protein